MKKTKKLNLDELKVESFITSSEGASIEGGGHTGANYTNPYPCACGPDITYQATCDGGCGTGANTNCGCPYTWFETCGCPPQTSQYTGCYC